MKLKFMSSLLLWTTIMCASISEKRVMSVLDAKDASSVWGSEHRIGVEMLKAGSLNYALQAFSRSAIVLPYPKESYPDILNRYYQLSCRFLLNEYSVAISIGESLIASIKNSKEGQHKFPFYRDILVTMVLLYSNVNCQEKKKATLNELGILSPFSANRIQERERLSSISNTGLISLLREIGDEKSYTIARKIETYGENLLWKSLFPEYSFYLQGKKIVSSVFLLMDFIIILPLVCRKPEILQTAIVAGVIRVISSFRIMQHFKKLLFANYKIAIDCVLEQKGLTSRQLINISPSKWNI